MHKRTSLNSCHKNSIFLHIIGIFQWQRKTFDSAWQCSNENVSPNLVHKIHPSIQSFFKLKRNCMMWQQLSEIVMKWRNTDETDVILIFDLNDGMIFHLPLFISSLGRRTNRSRGLFLLNSKTIFDKTFPCVFCASKRCNNSSNWNYPIERDSHLTKMVQIVT